MKNENNSLPKVIPFKAVMLLFFWSASFVSIGMSIFLRKVFLKDSIWDVSSIVSMVMVVFLLFIAAFGSKAIGKKFRHLESTPSCNEPYSKTFKFFFYMFGLLFMIFFGEAVLILAVFEYPSMFYLIILLSVLFCTVFLFFFYKIIEMYEKNFWRKRGVVS